MKPRDSFESQRLPEEFRVKFREAARAMEPSIPVQKQEYFRAIIICLRFQAVTDRE
jgi:hypothetical protein